jgi:mitochondrial intermediate peptidase
MNFLESLSKANTPVVEASLHPLREDKLRYEGREPFQAWDRNFYIHQKQSPQTDNLHLEPLHPYLSVGTVVQGLSRLYTRLWGIRLVPKETALGEVWHEDVRRLDVFDENDGHIGVIYCDLFSRLGKENTPPAHYTIRCSRKIGREDMDDTITARGYQLPIIALMCDFYRPSNGPGFLHWHQAETLFHEMGHAMHCTPTCSLSNNSNDRTQRLP